MSKNTRGNDSALTNLTCPSCGREIPVSLALQAEVTRRASAESEEKAAQAASAAKLAAKQEFQHELDHQRQELTALETQIRRAKDRELEIATRERKLVAAQQDMALAVEERLQAETKIIRENERKIVLAETARREEDLLGRLKEVEQARAHDRLDVKSFVEQRVALALEEAANQSAVDLEQKNLTIARLTGQIQALQRTAEAVPGEIRGEAFEQHIRDLLRRLFPQDVIEDVPKGRRGGDLQHHVTNSVGERAGMILWEIKATSGWQHGWVQKLACEQQRAAADSAAIITLNMPANLTGFGLVQDVWITNLKCLTGLATALRVGILRQSSIRRAVGSRDTRTRELLEYLTSPEFALSVRTIVTTIQQMEMDLEGEKRAMGKLWSRRQQLIVRLTENATATVARLESISADQLPSAEVLLLENMNATADNHNINIENED